MKLFQPASFNSSDSGGTIGGGVLGGTPGSVLFVNSASQLGQNNNNFYFQNSATTPTVLATNTTVALSVNTNGDFTGTDAINIYGQYDAFLPNSLITNSLAGLNTDGAFPGYTSSSARGTGASPSQLQTGDMVGGYFGFGAQGVSPTYQNLGGMGIFTLGASANNLGGELRWYTKVDGGSLTQNLTLSSKGFLGLNVASPAAQLNIGGNVSSSAWGVTGIAIEVDTATYTDTSTANSGTVAHGAITAFATPSIASTGTTVTYTNGSTVYIAGAPTNGTNVTITNPYSLFVATGGVMFGATTTVTGQFRVGNSSTGGNFIVAGTTNGVGSTNVSAAPLLPVNTGGTLASINYRGFFSGTTSTTIAQNASYGGLIVGAAPVTIPASSTSALLASAVIRPLGTVTSVLGGTVTNTATLYIDGASAAGTNNYSLWLASGVSRFDGAVLEQRPISAKTSAYPVVSTDSNTVFTNEGTVASVTFTLPTAVAGYTYTFVVQDADGIVVTASAGDTIRLGTSVSTVAGTATSTTIGSVIRLVAINATEWIGESVVGTWVTA